MNGRENSTPDRTPLQDAEHCKRASIACRRVFLLHLLNKSATVHRDYDDCQKNTIVHKKSRLCSFVWPLFSPTAKELSPKMISYSSAKSSTSIEAKGTEPFPASFVRPAGTGARQTVNSKMASAAVSFDGDGMKEVFTSGYRLYPHPADRLRV